MSVWTVKPEEVRLDLSYLAPDGTAHPFWIKVKKYLNVGEERLVMTAGWRGMSRDDAGGASAIQIDWKAQTFARTEAYLRDWSLKDDGHALHRDTIEALDSAVYGLIEDAITRHVEAMALEKKRPNSSDGPSTTSA